MPMQTPMQTPSPAQQAAPKAKASKPSKSSKSSKTKQPSKAKATQPKATQPKIKPLPGMQFTLPRDAWKGHEPESHVPYYHCVVDKVQNNSCYCTVYRTSPNEDDSTFTTTIGKVSYANPAVRTFDNPDDWLRFLENRKKQV